jgi:uncharacterized protein YceH (UPF0502 family)
LQHPVIVAEQEIALELELTAVEVRILGCLIEKQATTPDVYPLTVNALLAACNQKSNREPVMDLAASDTMTALDSLIEKTLASLYQSGRSRMAKYQHRLHQRAFDEFNFSTPELAILCVLFLRGPQTPGEIRSRSARIHEFQDPDAVIEVLRELEENPDRPYVKMLPRQAGRKESRYAHLFCGDVEELLQPAHGDQASVVSGNSRQQVLELDVAELKERVSALEHRLEEFVKQFE